MGSKREPAVYAAPARPASAAINPQPNATQIHCSLPKYRLAATQPLPPRQRKALHEAILKETLQERVVSSTSRVDFRGVKPKLSNCNLKPRKRRPTLRIDISKRVGIVK